MSRTPSAPRFGRTFRTLCLAVIITFVPLAAMPPSGYAEVLSLPVPGTFVAPSPAYRPVMLDGLALHPDNPLEFDFIVDRGQDRLADAALSAQVERLAKYFLTGLTLPRGEIWVNLSPAERDRMVSPALGRTELGRDLLEQDYLLKQLSASALHPEEETGKRFWDRVYQKAYERYGTTEIPVETFHKVWVTPAAAEVYERGDLNSAFIIESRLKVMLEEDFVSEKWKVKSEKAPGSEFQPSAISDPRPGTTLSTEIYREVVIPELEREINEGAHFARLRQAFHALILASWYKQALKDSVLARAYADRGKIAGVDLRDPAVRERIFERYLEAYHKGVFNFIRADENPATGKVLPRKYFSGGVNELAPKKVERRRDAAAGREAAQVAGDGGHARVNVTSTPAPARDDDSGAGRPRGPSTLAGVAGLLGLGAVAGLNAVIGPVAGPALAADAGVLMGVSSMFSAVLSFLFSWDFWAWAGLGTAVELMGRKFRKWKWIGRDEGLFFSTLGSGKSYPAPLTTFTFLMAVTGATPLILGAQVAISLAGTGWLAKLIYDDQWFWGEDDDILNATSTWSYPAASVVGGFTLYYAIIASLAPVYTIQVSAKHAADPRGFLEEIIGDSAPDAPGPVLLHENGGEYPLRELVDDSRFRLDAGEKIRVLLPRGVDVPPALKPGGSFEFDAVRDGKLHDFTSAFLRPPDSPSPAEDSAAVPPGQGERTRPMKRRRTPGPAGPANEPSRSHALPSLGLEYDHLIVVSDFAGTLVSGLNSLNREPGALEIVIEALTSSEMFIVVTGDLLESLEYDLVNPLRESLEQFGQIGLMEKLGIVHGQDGAVRFDREGRQIKIEAFAGAKLSKRDKLLHFLGLPEIKSKISPGRKAVAALGDRSFDLHLELTAVDLAMAEIEGVPIPVYVGDDRSTGANFAEQGVLLTHGAGPEATIAVLKFIIQEGGEGDPDAVFQKDSMQNYLVRPLPAAPGQAETDSPGRRRSLHSIALGAAVIGAGALALTAFPGAAVAATAVAGITWESVIGIFLPFILLLGIVVTAVYLYQGEQVARAMTRIGELMKEIERKIAEKSLMIEKNSEEPPPGGIAMDDLQPGVTRGDEAMLPAFEDEDLLQTLINAEGIVPRVNAIQPLTAPMIQMILGLTEEEPAPGRQAAVSGGLPPAVLPGRRERRTAGG